MIRQQFLQEVSSNLMIDSSGHDVINTITNSIIGGTFSPVIMEQAIVSTFGETFTDTGDDRTANPFDSWQSGSIAIIPLQGIMLKNGYWWTYGVDDIATIIRLAYKSEQVAAVILKTDTPGGSVDSLYLIQEVLGNKIKPTYGYIDGMCCSCGYIACSYLDRLYAINPMARVGGIGVFARLIIPNEKYEFYKVREVYPVESKDKNRPEREAEKGNDEALQKELSKIAVYFQDTVRGNRPNISEETLTGATYYAVEAEALGMIDGIRTLEQVTGELEQLVSRRKELLTHI